MEKNKKNVNEDLEGFDIKVNEFGELERSLPIERLNKFLNKNLEDKKLKGRQEEE